MTYRLRDDGGILDEWLATGPAVTPRTRVLTWLFELLEDPLSKSSTPVPLGMGLPVYTSIVPGTTFSVSYTVHKNPPYNEADAGVYLVAIREIG
jgi:hypothetical protein